MAEGVINLTDDNFKETTAEGLCLIDFWAPWCGPCQALGPVIEQLAAEAGDKAKICKVNTDDSKEIAVNFGIMGIPTIVILKNGEEVDRIQGGRSIEEFMQIIDKHV